MAPCRVASWVFISICLSYFSLEPQNVIRGTKLQSHKVNESLKLRASNTAVGNCFINKLSRFRN